MASSKEVQVYQTNLVTFVDCNPTDKLFGEKLFDIVKYASTQMGINNAVGNDAECAYTEYCNALEKKLGCGEPYITSVNLKECKKESIVNQMKDLLPVRVEKFDKLIENAAEKAVQVLNVDPRDIGEIFYKRDSKEFVASEFVVLKIFKSGENLEFIPCYMAVKGKKTSTRAYIFKWSESETSMEYKQQTFILTKFQIGAIINKLQAITDF